MADDRIARTRSLFAQAWRDDTIIDAVPGDLAPRDLAEATAMQDAMAAAIGEDVVGWKIAGKPGGPMGRIFASTSFENGATLPLPGTPATSMECEVGFRLKRDLPPREPPYEREEVAAAADLAFNIELVGFRRANAVEQLAAAFASGGPLPDDEAEMLVNIADNGGNLGLVNGPVIEDWQRRSLLDITVDLSIDGGESRPLLPKENRTDRSRCCSGPRTSCPVAASGWRPVKSSLPAASTCPCRSPSAAPPSPCSRISAKSPSASPRPEDGFASRPTGLPHRETSRWRS